MRLEWREVDRYLSGTVPGCEITLEPRPAYCDRGRWIAKVHCDPATRQGHELLESLDHQDGFPRYYFDIERAKLELDAWVNGRSELRPTP